MRTPGNDFELAAGFLFAEGPVSDRLEIARISHCQDPELGPEQRYNVVTVTLRRTRRWTAGCPRMRGSWW